MGVYDETRMGGIRFKLEKDGEFLSTDKETATPPWATLRTLEEASRQFENDETALDEKWLNQLLRPGEKRVPYDDELSLNVNENDNRISIPLAIETAHRFGIKEEDAMKMAKEITETVKTNWEKLAVKYGIPRGLTFSRIHCSTCARH